ncbi:MAG: histidinol dehydrogenase [bacterium]|nr:histidinol dehydrogenase [bacterium]MBU1918382.1 histidinol dehydrogenase [bacterium]
MKILRTTDRNFRYDFGKVFKRQFEVSESIQKTVVDILDDIKRIGDQALQKYTNRLDFFDLTGKSMEVTAKEMAAALKEISPEDKKAIDLIASRIKEFYKQQKITKIASKKGDIDIQLITKPLERVGIYVPGGKASYPSTVLMTAIPAKLAGVEEIIMCSPWSNGEYNPAVLYAAHVAGVKQIFKIGGAQAIAAMAYGTKTVPKVDKIIGPGNTYVSWAKKLVFGEVAIDMIAGPTELVILGDGTVPPAYVASDLLSQAEHDELASTLLITTNANYAIRVEGEVRKQVLKLKRKAIANESIKKRGLIVLVRNLNEAIDLVNEMAPEHLEICTKDPEKVLTKIKHAGTIFLGPYTPESIGDYVAGPSHVLPTHGTARFFSALSIYDFIKTIPVIKFGQQAFNKFGPTAAQLAENEGLTAHANSINLRIEKPME